MGTSTWVLLSRNSRYMYVGLRYIYVICHTSIFRLWTTVVWTVDYCIVVFFTGVAMSHVCISYTKAQTSWQKHDVYSTSLVQVRSMRSCLDSVRSMSRSTGKRCHSWFVRLVQVQLYLVFKLGKQRESRVIHQKGLVMVESCGITSTGHWATGH